MKERNHQPDFERFRQQIKRQIAPGSVPIAEFFADGPIVEELTGEQFPSVIGDGILDWSKMSKSDMEEASVKVVELIKKFCLLVGMDYMYIELDPGLNLAECISLASDSVSERRTWWHIDSQGPIQTWEEFERFPWPRVQDLDFSLLDCANRIVPDGMKIFVLLSGVFDLTSWSMGFENFAIALYDQLDLVKAIVRRVTEILIYQVETALQYENVGGIWLGDDLGFQSGTLIQPDMIRKIILPQHRHLIELTHNQDRLFFLHACGNLEMIMPDIIATGIDAKHSFEDKILPVEKAYQRWGEEIGIVGGLDMDLITRGSEEDIRRRTREVLDVCGAKGGYALGTGNSVADYVPARNFLIMVDEGRKWNEEHFSA